MNSWIVLHITGTRWTNKQILSQSPKMGLLTNNSRTRIGLFRNCVIWRNERDYFSASNSIPLLKLSFQFYRELPQAWSRSRQGVIPVSLLLFSLPKCPDFCWCNVLEAEVEGKQKADGNHAVLCSFAHIGPSCTLHYSETGPKTSWRVTWWVSRAGN